METMNQVPVIAGVEIPVDAAGRYNLNALHRASGGEKKNGPSYWLALGSTKELVDEMGRQNSDTGISVSPLNVLKGGAVQGSFAHELLAVSYAGWISPAFQLKVNQVFIDYRTGKLAEPAIPQTRAEALRLAADLEEEKLRLEQQVEESAPKVAFAEQVEVAQDAITMAEAGKVLGTGRNRLLAFLRRNGWVTRRNEPYQSKIEAGLMDVKLSSWEHPEHGLQESVTALVTGKGLTRIQQMLSTLQ